MYFVQPKNYYSYKNIYFSILNNRINLHANIIYIFFIYIYMEKKSNVYIYDFV